MSFHHPWPKFYRWKRRRSGLVAPGGSLSWPNDFGGTAGDSIPVAPLDGRYTTLNPLDVDAVETINGRLRMQLLDNFAPPQTPPVDPNGKSLWWHASGYNLVDGVFEPMIGRNDGLILYPPFDIVLLGVRFGTITDPFTIPANMVGNGSCYNFGGLQVSHPLDPYNYSHIVYGPRAGNMTCEVKRTRAGTYSWQGDVGTLVTTGVDLRVVMVDYSHADLYHRLIGATPWNLATVFGTEPDYGSNGVKCSFVQYAFGANDPFGIHVDSAVWGPTHPV